MINGQWIGRMEGSFNAALYAEFQEISSRNIARLHLGEGGQANVYVGEVLIHDGNVSCEFREPMAKPSEAAPTATTSVVAAEPKEPAADGSNAALTLNFDRITQTHIAGRWKDQRDNAGVFHLALANTRGTLASVRGAKAQDAASVNPPTIVSKSVPLPNMELYKNDLVEIINVIRRSVGNDLDVVVSYSEGGNEVSLMGDRFIAKSDLPNILKKIRFTLSDQRDPIHRNIQVVFAKNVSSIYVSASDEVWVNGVALKIEETINKKSSTLAWIFQKYALNINALVLLVAIALSPDLKTGSRFLFFAIVVSAMLMFWLFHSWASRIQIWTNRNRASNRNYRLADILTAIAGSVGAAVILGSFSFLTNDGLTKIFKWLAQHLVSS